MLPPRNLKGSPRLQTIQLFQYVFLFVFLFADTYFGWKTTLAL